MATAAGQGAGAGKRRQRARRREADRALVPVVVSQRLGVPVADAAHAMRAAGVTGPLTVRQAKEWAGDPGSAPEWLSGLWGERMARAAQQEYHREQQREQHAVRELAVEQSALAKVKAGKRRFTDDEWLLVEDWAFRAAKDLVRGGHSTLAARHEPPVTAVPSPGKCFPWRGRVPAPPPERRAEARASRAGTARRAALTPR
jgi:nucleotidyltransferase/DNA polymerase involved in DNA repair